MAALLEQSLLPAFVFEARPVIPIDDAVRVESAMGLSTSD
jgi:hypothetical protein